MNNVHNNELSSYCSGSLELTLDSVVSLVSAGDLLLLDWVVARCQQFLTDNIHLDNVVTAARLASVYRMGDLDKLALKYQETQFRDLVSSQVSLILILILFCQLDNF